MKRAIIGALTQARIKPSDIDMINTHAASTVAGDEAEIKALESIFSEVLVTSNKGHIGHTLGAAGGVESVLSILSIRDNIIPHTANLETPIKTRLNLVSKSPVKKEITTVLKESIAFGGTNACIIFRKT